MPTHVPTAEEIRRALESRDTFVTPWDRLEREKVADESAKKASRAALDAKSAARTSQSLVQSLSERVEDLVKKVEIRGRSTPQELRAALNALFEAEQFSPAEELMRMLTDKEHEFYVTDLQMRVRILTELQQYVMPKLKSTEIRGKIDHAHTIVIQRIGSDGQVMREPLRVPGPREVRPVTDIEEIKR